MPRSDGGCGLAVGDRGPRGLSRRRLPYVFGITIAKHGALTTRHTPPICYKTREAAPRLRCVARPNDVGVNQGTKDRALARCVVRGDNTGELACTASCISSAFCISSASVPATSGRLALVLAARTPMRARHASHPSHHHHLAAAWRTGHMHARQPPHTSITRAQAPGRRLARNVPPCRGRTPQMITTLPIAALAPAGMRALCRLHRIGGCCCCCCCCLRRSARFSSGRWSGNRCTVGAAAWRSPYCSSSSRAVRGRRESASQAVPGSASGAGAPSPSAWHPSR